jgi:chromosomal replication initiation ATPase DnaA
MHLTIGRGRVAIHSRPVLSGRMSHTPSPSRVAQYAAEAAADNNVDPADVMGTARTASFVRARCHMWRRLYEDGFSMAEIGKAVGRHHTTVMHALRKDEESDTLRAPAQLNLGL